MMQPALDHDQHRAARRQVGEPAMRRGGAPSCIGHKFQLPDPPSRHGRLTSCKRPNSRATPYGSGFLFAGSRRNWCGRISAPLAFDTVHHVLADFSDVPHRHVERLSFVLADGTNHSEALTHAAGSITQGLGNV